MIYRSYQHVERLGTTETNGILDGTCYIFPKIDGTNATLWLGNDNTLRAGSRKRELSLEDDNAGFCAFANGDDDYLAFLRAFPNLRLYGEWLVPHSLRTYRDDAWRRFYIFDVMEEAPGREPRYLAYEEYQLLLEQYGLNYIPPLKIIENPREQDIYDLLPMNTFLIEDGKGSGEGVVIKNYAYKNPYGRQTWAKIVANEFKERHSKAMGAPQVAIDTLERRIAETYITRALVEKEKAKIELKEGGWSPRHIPRLLGQIWHCLIAEEMWNILKKFKPKAIDFRELNRRTNLQVKAVMPEIF